MGGGAGGDGGGVEREEVLKVGEGGAVGGEEVGVGGGRGGVCGVRGGGLESRREEEVLPLFEEFLLRVCFEVGFD